MAKYHANVEQPLEEESYFVSMTDMMVGLLFIFILMLMYFALQFNKTAEQLTNANKTRGEILVKIEESLKSQGFEVEINPESGVLRLNEKVLEFAHNSADIRYEYRKVIEVLANALGDVLPCYSNKDSYELKSCKDNSQQHWLEAVFIEGHTDNTGSLSNNLELSAKRAVSTYLALTRVRNEIESLKNGDGQPLLSVSGYADKRPRIANDTAEHLRMNRRIELRIIMATPKKENENQPVLESIKERIE